jgi:hypothetical protein
MTQIKVFDPFPRKQGTSLAEFSHYWITHHAELAKEFRRIRRYVQSVRLEHKPVALGPPLAETWCDGCAETWHRDAASVDEMPDDERFPDLMEDEANFIDVTHRRYLLKAEERLLDERDFDPRLRGVKVLLFVRRSPSLRPPQFVTAWTADVAATWGRQLGVTRHVVCSAIGHIERAPSPETGSPAGASAASADDGYDGVRELWWPNMSALEAGLTRAPDAASRLFRPGSIDPARSFALVAHERVIVP